MSLRQSSKRQAIALLLITTILFSTLVSACQKSEATPTRSVSGSDIQVNITGPTREPYQFKTSEPGTVSVHGTLAVLDPMSLVPAPDDAVFLVPIADVGISTIPEFTVGSVPQAEVDESTGEFMFTNLQPGQYAVVVITKGGAQIPTRFYESGNFAIFTLDSSQIDTTVELELLSLP